MMLDVYAIAAGYTGAIVLGVALVGVWTCTALASALTAAVMGPTSRRRPVSRWVDLPAHERAPKFFGR